MSVGVYDLTLKPKLLRSLIKEYVPDEKHPFENPSELSYVVSTVKTHKLLSESATEPLTNDLVDTWKSSVDSWVKRAITLASSNSADKCWAGVCLLGVTSQECSSDRFLGSYVVWLNKIFSVLQSSEGPHLVKSACCASLSDMFTRLSGLPNAKKDATSQATKFVQLVLKFFTKDISPVLLEEALSVLLTMIKLYPSLIHRHYDSVEAVIVTQIMSGKCCASALKKLVNALALLPQSRGDEESWSLLMLKILLCINSQLNDAFQCLEEESKGTETMWLLLPKGKESPPTLGGLVMSELSSELSSRRAEQLLQCRISTLMECCSNMLTISYPVMVSLPIRGLIALAHRVLMVDGSQVESSYPSMSILKQEFVCSELPQLQLQSLDILMAVVKGLSSQLLPHAADIAGLLTEYLSSCKFPNLRVKAYSIIKFLLMSMGIGIAIHMNQDIINNVFIDLDFVGGENSLCTYRKVQEELPTRQRKRKHSNVVQEQNAGDCLPVEPLNYLTPISVKIAAVDALETLLTAGGSMRSESWRANVDHLLITVATDACKGSLSNDESNIVCGEPISIWVEFRLAALRALLASLLSPGRVRPSHLGLSLELFRKGVQETGTETAILCGHALLSLEVLIHPRGLPLLDLDSTINNYKVHSQNYPQRHVYTFQPHTPGKVGPSEPESDNDDLNEIWIGNDDETEMQLTEEHENNTLVIEKDLSSQELPSFEITHKTSELRLSVNPVDSTAVRDRDDLMAESAQFRNDESEPLRKKIALSEKDIAIKRDMVSEGHNLKVSASEHVLQNKEDGFAAIVEQISATLVNTERSMFEADDESSLESIPDIVDGDPDSD